MTGLVRGTITGIALAAPSIVAATAAVPTPLLIVIAVLSGSPPDDLLRSAALADQRRVDRRHQLWHSWRGRIRYGPRYGDL
jgi:hypothetical protein